MAKLTELTSAKTVDNADYSMFVDVSDTTMAASGTNKKILFSDLKTTLGIGSGSGDVVGPSSATDNALARFDTTTGKLIQNSAATVDDSGILSTASIIVSGTGGSGHINLRHQASDASATGQSTALFADANGDLKYKNDGDFYTTFVTSSNTADRSYTFLDASYIVAGVAAALTSSRVPYADSNGLLTDTADLNWVNSTKTLTIAGTSTASSGIFTSLNVQATANQSGTAGYKTIVVNTTETATGSGTKYLADFQVGGSTRTYITNKGTVGLSNGIEVGYDPGGASASQNAIRNVGGISFAASTGGYGADNFHFDGTNMYYDCANGLMFFRPQGSGNYALYLNNNSTGLEYKNGSGTTIFSVASSGNTYTAGVLDLGNASDTTISRVSAGVIAVEGVTVPTISSTNTLTNKRITKRTGTTTSSATPTINTDNVDFYSLTAQAVDITSFTTNLSGTPTDGQTLWIAITGTAARAITWGSSFEASTVALPTTTVTTNRLDVGFIWNTATSKWRCVASS